MLPVSGLMSIIGVDVVRNAVLSFFVDHSDFGLIALAVGCPESPGCW